MLLAVGTHNCTINVHLLRHIVRYVRLYGPLWTHSCFWFEELNGKLLKMFHGTQHVALQVKILICKSKLVEVLSYISLQIISNWEMQKAIEKNHPEKLVGVPESTRRSLLHLSGRQTQLISFTQIRIVTSFDCCSQQNWEKIDTNLYCVGGKRIEIIDEKLLDELAVHKIQQPVKTFSRLCMKGEMYWSARYVLYHNF